jgi:hypothetical protein
MARSHPMSDTAISEICSTVAVIFIIWVLLK